jgi:hypothetical protein
LALKLPQQFVWCFSYFNIAGIWAGMHTVRYFDGKTYKWVGLSRQPNIIGKVCFFPFWFVLSPFIPLCSNLWFPFEIDIACMILFHSNTYCFIVSYLWLLPGEKNVRSIHASSVGQRWVASVAGSMAIYSSPKSLHCIFDCRAEYILFEVLSMDTSAKFSCYI